MVAVIAFAYWAASGLFTESTYARKVRPCALRGLGARVPRLAAVTGLFQRSRSPCRVLPCSSREAANFGRAAVQLGPRSVLSDLYLGTVTVRDTG
jgi:hypothetical protein